MATKERVQVLAPGVDLFFKAVIVFTSAWVDAKFRTTGLADCISDNQLVKHIVDSKSGAITKYRIVKTNLNKFMLNK